MIAVTLYLVTLVIAPQLWVPPFVGLPTDYLTYPLLIVTAYYSSRESTNSQLGAPDWFLLGLTVWVALSAAVNGLTEASRPQVVFYCKFFLVFELFAYILRDINGARKFARVMTFIVGLIAIEAIQQKLSADGLGWAGQTRAWIDPGALAAGAVGRSRWIGMFDGPGVFCVIFTICLPFPLTGLTRRNPMTRRMLSAFVLILLLGATYCTGSRGGFLASLAVIALYVMIQWKISIRTIVISSVLVLLAFAFAPDYLTTMNDPSRSAQHRVEMWADGMDMVKESPVFGIGRGNFQAYTYSLIAHNSAIQMMGETGLIGFFLWIGLIYTVLRSCITFRRSAQDEEDKEFTLALILSMLGYLVSSMFVTLEYETFYILMAACYATGRPAAGTVQVRFRDLASIGAIEGAWIVGLQVFLLAYLG